MKSKHTPLTDAELDAWEVYPSRNPSRSVVLLREQFYGLITDLREARRLLRAVLWIGPRGGTADIHHEISNYLSACDGYRAAYDGQRDDRR